MPINLAGSYAAGGVHDALLEIVKQRMLEQELAQREEENRYQRARGERQDRRLDEQDKIAAAERQREAVKRKFDILNSGNIPQADLNAQLGEEASPLVPTTPPATIGGVPMPSGVKSYRLPAVPIQAKPMMVDGASIRPRSREQAMADTEEAATSKAMNTGVQLSPGEVYGTPKTGPLMRGGAVAEKWEPIEVSINGKNVQLERNASGDYRYPVTQQAVTNGLGPKIPERAPQRDRYVFQQGTKADGTIGLIRIDQDSGATNDVTLPEGYSGAGRPTTGQYKASTASLQAQAAGLISRAFETQLQDLGPQLAAQLPELLKTPLGRKYAQARREWIETVLRPKSGAAIRPDEYVNYERIYFATGLDSPELIEQKQASRDRAEQMMKMESGNLQNQKAPAPAGGNAPPAGPRLTPQQYYEKYGGGRATGAGPVGGRGGEG